MPNIPANPPTIKVVSLEDIAQSLRNITLSLQALSATLLRIEQKIR